MDLNRDFAGSWAGGGAPTREVRESCMGGIGGMM